MQTELKAHPFEATLGPGPYRVVGFFDLGSAISALQSGNVAGYNNALAMAPQVERGFGTCAHCGHAILNIYIIQCFDGKRFGIGSDCVFKAGLPAKELTKVERNEKARQKKQRQERKAKNAEKARNELKALAESHTNELMAFPHPTRINCSLLDYVFYTIDHGSQGGLIFVLKLVKNRLKF